MSTSNNIGHGRKELKLVGYCNVFFLRGSSIMLFDSALGIVVNIQCKLRATTKKGSKRRITDIIEKKMEYKMLKTTKGRSVGDKK